MYNKYIKTNEQGDLKMKKSDKEKIIKMVSEIYGKYCHLKFSTIEDIKKDLGNANGCFRKREKEIVVKQNCMVSTLAHEIAHAIQFSLKGDTDCLSSIHSKKHNAALSDQHSQIAYNIEIQLSNNGIEEAWNIANDCYPRVKKSNIGKEQIIINK